MTKYLTIDEVKEIPKLLKEGWTVPEIAKKFNCHVQTIHSWIRKLRASGQEIKLKTGRVPLINRLRRDR